MTSKEALLLMYFRIGNGKGQGASFQKLKNFQISLLENFISSKLCILKTFKDIKDNKDI